MSKFINNLSKRWDAGARVCVGLDPVWDRIPEAQRCGASKCGPSAAQIVHDYFLGIASAAAEYAGAFKPNHAFFEGLGNAGLNAAAALYRSLRKQFPEIPLILDVKRQDIGKTNVAILEMLREHDVTAATFHGYLGMEASQPFLDEKDLGNFILCKTSNPGSGEFQDKTSFIPTTEVLEIINTDPGELVSKCGWVVGSIGDIPGYFMPHYQYVALRVSRVWNKNGNCGLVVGATFPEQLGIVRSIVGPKMPLLIPGYGAQGASLEDLCRQGMNSDGTGAVINESSSICYPAGEGADPFEAAAARAKDTNSKIAGFITE